MSNRFRRQERRHGAQNQTFGPVTDVKKCLASGSRRHIRVGNRGRSDHHRTIRTDWSKVADNDEISSKEVRS
jgi:hypothetical protein